jgi:predicted CoA-binding protein
MDAVEDSVSTSPHLATVASVGNPPEHELRRIYGQTETIAVVGASDDPSKHSRSVPEYLQSQGYRIVPVNGSGGEVLGEPAFRSLLEIEIPVDVVDVFRLPKDVPPIAEEAAAIGAKVLWLQRGIVSDEARQIAADHGLIFVEDICMAATHALLEIPPRLDP